MESPRMVEFIYVCKICGKKIRSINKVQAMSWSVSHLFSHYGANKDVTDDLRRILEKYFEEKTDILQL